MFVISVVYISVTNRNATSAFPQYIAIVERQFCYEKSFYNFLQFLSHTLCTIFSPFQNTLLTCSNILPRFSNFGFISFSVLLCCWFDLQVQYSFVKSSLSVSNEIHSILDTVNPMEPALEPLLPFLSPDIVTSIIQD